MAAKIYATAGDTNKQVDVTLADAGTPVDLTGVTAIECHVFNMASQTLTTVAGLTGTVAGVVETVIPGPLSPGTYSLEWEVTDGTTITTYPGDVNARPWLFVRSAADGEPEAPYGGWQAATINIVDSGAYFTATDVEGALQELAAGGGGGGATDLDDLTDVTITTPANGNVLSFNGSAWVNTTPAGGGDLLAANNLSELTATAATARTNLGLGTAAVEAASAFDAAGAAAAAQAASQPLAAVLTNTTASYTTTLDTKLANIEALADVTDATNVEAAGALMDSEVTNLAAVKAFDAADYATAAQGTTADTALQPTTLATVTGTADTLAAGDDRSFIQYTAAGAVTVTLANIATGFEAVLVSLGAGGLAVAAGGMSYANSFTPKLTVAQGEAIYVKQTAASTWIVLGATAT